MTDQIIQRHWNPTFGADPELFLAKGDQIIGAEKVIPKDGIKLDAGYSANSIVLDGVQIELHMQPSACRATFGNSMRLVFQSLKKTLDQSKGFSASFAPVVEVDKEELASLSEAARQLGCAPSLNTYDANATIKVGKDFRTRSAGGHIHVGFGHMPNLMNHVHKYPKLFVDLQDIFVGLPSVMIDRSPTAAERRKTYGRAGEYRLPKYGVEYRTLSNFWLRSFQLTSLMLGLSRLAANVFIYQDPATSKVMLAGDYYNIESPLWDATGEILSATNLSNVQKAINTNDYDLARQTWEPVAKFIKDHVPTQDTTTNKGTLDHIFPLDESNIDAFQYFCDEIEQKGIERWFPMDPMSHWVNLQEVHRIGWEAFLAQIVIPIQKQESLSRIIGKLKE